MTWYSVKIKHVKDAFNEYPASLQKVLQNSFLCILMTGLEHLWSLILSLACEAVSRRGRFTQTGKEAAIFLRNLRYYQW